MVPRRALEADMNTLTLATLHAMWDTKGVEAHRERVKLTDSGLGRKQLVKVNR